MEGITDRSAADDSPCGSRDQDSLYLVSSREFGAALARLANAYEANPDLRRDLLQEIHLALWRSFASFNGRCSVRTWAYRVAHNVAASHVERQRRWSAKRLCGLDQLEDAPAPDNVERLQDERSALERLYALVHQLKPLDRQLISLFLEGLDAKSIGEITGLSNTAVATKVHRIKSLLAARFAAKEHP